nr:Metallophosphoesterase and Mre11 domain containing protein [Haemonchus contortus]
MADMNFDEDEYFVRDVETEEDTKKEEEETSQRPPPAHDTQVENIEKATDDHEDILRILIASDIHVGYGENKPNLYLDSVNTFEEVLKIATEKKVDMVLLGGDLFHENNPSRDMQHRVIQLLRQYCLNDREVALEFVSDASVNFEHSRFDRVNYEDANINVGLPIFTIHGNHDDTAGKGLTILDVLHEAGLVNLFGKFSDIDQFDDEMIIDDKISEMIRWAETNRGPQQPKLPLIRLKVTYAGPWAIMQPINARHIGAKFEDRVANASEMVVTRRVVEKKKKKGGATMEEDQGDIIDAACLDQVISEHFNKLPWEERLTVFTHPIIGKALTAFDDDEKANTAKANQEFRTALEAARDSMISKLKQMPAPEIEFDKFGNLKSDNFEMMVRNDLNMLKRQTYGIQGDVVTRRDEFDDEMEDDA